MRKIKKAVITAAGFGSRFLPVVKAVPKEMLPIIDKPILQYVVEECVEAGIEEIIIVVRKGNDVIRNYFFESVPVVKQLLDEQGRSDRYSSVTDVLDMGARIKIFDQDPDLPYGNGSPILTVKDQLIGEEAFAVLFADDLVITKGRSSIGQLVDIYEKHEEADAVMGVQRVPDEEVQRYASIKPKDGNADADQGQVDYLIEKPEPGTEPSNVVSYGRFIVPFRIFDFLTADATGKDEELWLQDANHQLAQTGNYMYRVINGDWYTTGDPIRHFEALTRFFLADERYKNAAAEVLDKIRG